MTDTIDWNGVAVPVFYHHTVVLGSGAASLAAAVRLKRSGVDDICIITDNMKGGTSRNTGSDKQTYYKLSDSSGQPDSPYLMAQSIFKGGAVHGDLALVESLCSENGFYHLVGLGVDFPYNRWGGYTGYKTDHDPNARGTSLGPYTSKKMVEALEKEVNHLDLCIRDHHDVVKLLTGDNRIVGAIVLNKRDLDSNNYGVKVVLCDNMVFGLGGPGGLYRNSVYPPAHTGGIGLALEAGAQAVNLTESQFGIGSVKFRWNLSGSYQQVIPSYYSIDPETEEKHYFLNAFFPSMDKLASAIFLKGYQWPFDPGRILNHGSSLIDLLIYREEEILGRKVYMDFRENPVGDVSIGVFTPHSLSEEAREYWKQSGLTGKLPIDRLFELNPDAVELYRDHHIDLVNEPLQITVAAQHNNGGLAGDHWWESVNLKHFFPIGEVNGSHGIYRPGGTALNAGQVGAWRASQKIAREYRESSLDLERAMESAEEALSSFMTLVETITSASPEEKCERRYAEDFQYRMSKYGALIRDMRTISLHTEEAASLVDSFRDLRISRSRLPYALKQRHLAISHWFYLKAIEDYLAQGGGSRGSFLVLDDGGTALHEQLEEGFTVKNENPELKAQMQKIVLDTPSGDLRIFWEACRDIPREEHWFETVWGEYKQGKIFAL